MNRIPKEQVIKDMSNYDYMVADAAIDYYYSVYSSPEEQKEYMKRKHSERLKDKIAGFMLLGGFILLLAVTIGGQL